MELLAAALLLPHARMDFGLPWSALASASDASPGGHGFAYTKVGTELAQRWASVAAHRGDYTMLCEEHDFRLPEEKYRRLQGAELPLARYHWKTVGRPGGWDHINVEEYRAFNWAIEERVLRGENDLRCVRVGDSAAQVGAHAKCRYASWKLLA